MVNHPNRNTGAGDIYEQHRAAFKRTGAFVVTTPSGDLVAKVAFAYPKDGSGRLYCYFHVLGSRMARGYATGGGYDKATAAAHVAVNRAYAAGDTANTDAMPHLKAMSEAISDAGTSWDHDLRDAGYRVFAAI